MPKRDFMPSEGMEEGKDYEEYAPEFDVQVKVASEMPSGRSYYMELAKELYGVKAIDLETLWDVMETGKFPPKEIILDRLFNRNGEQPPTDQPPQPGQPPQEQIIPPQEGMMPPGEQMSPDVAQMPPQMFPPQQPQQPQQSPMPGNLPPNLLQLLMNGGMPGGR
ncbi:MAG: hypothetical protein VR69_03835 [Peptococcaceae bacterium BRH_c4b]|nr:MAG: hypothetical protein VR69_03835 [Peptococcaceae bacterium BRH_c4b]